MKRPPGLACGAHSAGQQRTAVSRPRSGGNVWSTGLPRGFVGCTLRAHGLRSLPQAAAAAAVIATKGDAEDDGAMTEESYQNRKCAEPRLACTGRECCQQVAANLGCQPRVPTKFGCR